MIEEFEGRGFAPGTFGHPKYSNVPRQLVERLLRSWFVWLEDRARIHIRPAGSGIEAEIQIRRWKTKPDLVTFRWRNSGPTRHVFDPVQAAFAEERPEAEIELTAKTRKARALTLSTSSDDVMAPAWATGLTVSAFRHAGVGSVTRFDVETHSRVRSELSTDVPLEPLSQAWEAGHRIGAAVGRIFKPFG